MQDRKPQPRDLDTIIIDIPNTFYLEHGYNNIDIYKSYDTYLSITFLLVKKESDLKLLLKLRKYSLIKTPSVLFEVS
jgi:hypothetical protein